MCLPTRRLTCAVDNKETIRQIVREERGTKMGMTIPVGCVMK